MVQSDTLLILDFGSPSVQRIAHCIQQVKVSCEIHPAATGGAWLREYAASRRLRGIVLSGGHAGLDLNGNLASPVVFELGVPVLGICHGMRAMALRLGGQVRVSDSRELAVRPVRVHGRSRLLAGLADSTSADGHALLHAWMHEGSQVGELPEGFSLAASSAGCLIAAMADEQRRFYGVQFHPEIPATPQGCTMLRRFACEICAADD